MGCWFRDASARQIFILLRTSSSFPFPIPRARPPFRPTVRTSSLTMHALSANGFTETMVFYKSVLRAIFRPEHTDDTTVTLSSSKSRRKLPTRAFTVPARPHSHIEQPEAGPSSQKQLKPYANNPNRHSAVALRDILSPRPRLRKNSLPSQFQRERSTLPPRVSASPTPILDGVHPQEQRQLAASPVPDSRKSGDYHREPHSSPDARHFISLNGDPTLCDHFDIPLPVSGVRDSSDINLLLSSEPRDARKAISKRLEGLAMALDMFQPIQTPSPTTPPKKLGVTPRGLTRLDTSLDVTHPLITLPLPPKSPSALGSTSLSPIENWRDDEGEGQLFDYDETDGEYDEEESYFALPGSKLSQSSQSSVSSSTSELPPTPVDLPTHPVDAVQLLLPFLSASPVAFNLGPVVQSRVDNCKATPTPVVSVDTFDAHSGIVRV